MRDESNGAFAVMRICRGNQITERKYDPGCCIEKLSFSVAMKNLSMDCWYLGHWKPMILRYEVWVQLVVELTNLQLNHISNKTCPDCSKCWSVPCYACVPGTWFFLGNGVNMKLQTLVSCTRHLRNFQWKCSSLPPVLSSLSRWALGTWSFCLSAPPNIFCGGVSSNASRISSYVSCRTILHMAFEDRNWVNEYLHISMSSTMPRVTRSGHERKNWPVCNLEAQFMVAIQQFSRVRFVEINARLDNLLITTIKRISISLW